MTVRVRAAIATGALAALALAGAAGCSGDDKPEAGASTPPPAPAEVPESELNDVPEAKGLKGSDGLRRPVTYSDKVTVSIATIRYVKDTATGRGVIKGRVKTIFTLKFVNGSARALDLNAVRVVAKYGPSRRTAEPVSHGDINDFFGSVAPGKSRSASYAFDLPYPDGYKNVWLGVRFDAEHKTAVFAGSLKP
jgi:hypothetical protein